MAVLCAVCDATNATTRLCSRCRADPANASWQATPPSQETRSSRPQAERFAYEVAWDPARHGRPRPLETLAERIAWLAAYGRRTEARVYRDARGRRRGTRIRRHYLGQRSIARLAGCSRSYVRKVLSRI